VSNAEQVGEVPSQVAAVLPTGAGHTQAIVKSLENDISAIKDSISAIRDNRHTDFVYLISIFAAGFLLMATLFGFGFFRLDDKFDKLTDKLGDKTDKLNAAGIRSETKLEDLLQRIPPIVAPAPERRSPGATAPV
jgi:hypothetical protein